MDTDALLGIRRPNMDDLREVKVRIPARQLVRLHMMKLVSARNFSEIVSDALRHYFQQHGARLAETEGAAGLAAGDGQR